MSYGDPGRRRGDKDTRMAKERQLSMIQPVAFLKPATRDRALTARSTVWEMTCIGTISLSLNVNGRSISRSYLQHNLAPGMAGLT